MIHHGAWTRIKQVTSGRDDTTTYVKHSVPLTITVSHDLFGQTASITIIRGAEKHRSPLWTYDAFKTGERDKLRDEVCDVWNVARHFSHDGPRNARRELNRLSCVTQDGIEVWNKFVGDSYQGSLHEAVSLERRPVAASEVEPPPDLLAWPSWAPTAPPARPDTATDAVTRLETDEGASPHGPMRVIRQHYPWRSVETVDIDGSRVFTLSHAQRLLSLSIEMDANDRFTSLSLRRTPPDVAEAADKSLAPRDLGRTESVLGETCTWRDMRPGMMDAFDYQCFTADGIVLKSRSGGRARQTTFVAKHLERKPLSLAEVLPSPATFEPQNWGISER
ncbi:hypothetical protein MXD81_35560 [Microbacteriaceae bacterium K1510]|nr:hypothetical protein [Microbacteriaceae bacterium K1510]